MHDLLLLLEIVAGLACLLLLLFVARRIFLARAVGSFDCSIRDLGSGSWSFGIARYGAGRLDWYRVFSLSPKPSRVYRRDRLEIIGRRDPTAVPVVLGGELDLALSEDAYVGLSSWAEAAPPGMQAEFS
jgi:hypothetical protein